MYCRECGERLEEDALVCPRCKTEVAEHVRIGIPGQDTSTNGTHMAPGQEGERPRHPVGRILLTLLGLMGVLFCQIIGALVVLIFRLNENPVMGLDETSVTLLAGALGCCGIVALMGGASSLRLRLQDISYAARRGWWLIATSVGLALFEFVGMLVEGEFQLADDWATNLVYVAFVCVLIGVFEEFSFRLICFGGLLGAFGKSRRGVIVAAVISSLAFGAAHVEWTTVSPEDPIQLAQIIGKIVQTGTFAFFLASIVCETRTGWGSAFLHGATDFLLMVVSVALTGGSMDVDYVSTGDDGIETLILYAVVIVLYIPLVIRAWRSFKKLRVPDYGWLWHEDAGREDADRVAAA